MADEPLGPILLEILTCAQENLTNPVALVTITPGNTVAWDDCCEGELWARVVSVVGASSMSNPRLQPCAATWQVRFEVGVIRCAHVVDDAGNIPTAAQMTADALATYQDRADLTYALMCCVPGIPGIQDLQVGDWLPQGPEGGCVGGTLTSTFTLT